MGWQEVVIWVCFTRLGQLGGTNKRGQERLKGKRERYSLVVHSGSWMLWGKYVMGNFMIGSGYCRVMGYMLSCHGLYHLMGIIL